MQAGWLVCSACRRGFPVTAKSVIQTTFHAAPQTEEGGQRLFKHGNYVAVTEMLFGANPRTCGSWTLTFGLGGEDRPQIFAPLPPGAAPSGAARCSRLSPDAESKSSHCGGGGSCVHAAAERSAAVGSQGLAPFAYVFGALADAAGDGGEGDDDVQEKKEFLEMAEQLGAWGGTLGSGLVFIFHRHSLLPRRACPKHVN